MPLSSTKLLIIKINFILLISNYFKIKYIYFNKIRKKYLLNTIEKNILYIKYIYFNKIIKKYLLNRIEKKINKYIIIKIN